MRAGKLPRCRLLRLHELRNWKAPYDINLLALPAEFELELIRERVKAGMDRAARQGEKIGRPRVTDRRRLLSRYRAILECLSAGEISRGRAARELGIGDATLKRLLDSNLPT